MVVSTILERNPELMYSETLDMDEVSDIQNCVSYDILSSCEFYIYSDMIILHAVVVHM